MIEPLGASAKALLDTIKQWTTIVSVVLSVLAIHVLVRFLHHATTLYRNLLIAITIMSMLSDLLLQIFLDPLFMFPLPCVHMQGLLGKWANFSPVLGFEVWVSCISSVMLLYGFCVVYRNQVILPPNHRLRLPKWVKISLSVIFSTSIFTQGQILEFAVERSDEAIASYLTNLSDGWPAGVRNRTTCAVPVQLYAVVAEYVMSIAFWCLFAVVVCSHTFYTLSRLEIMSEKTRASHRRLTKSLVLQVVVPVLTILLPESGLTFRYFFNFESPEFAPIIMKCLGVHSIAHSLTVIASSNEFARALCGKRSVRKITVSTSGIGR